MGISVVTNLAAISDAAQKILQDTNVILAEQHFVYISGDHGSGWVNKDALLPHPDRMSELARLLAIAVKPLGAEVVCGPATGGIVVSQWLAHHLAILSAFAEHDKTKSHKRSESGALLPEFVLRRDFDRLVKNRRVLVVDDIVNTGLSVRQTAQCVAEAGGNVIGVACFCTRGNTTAQTIGVDNFIYLCEIDIACWPEKDCPLCKQNVPINVEHAHGREYLERMHKQ
jgi:orotate phosphoribosyltransferase